MSVPLCRVHASHNHGGTDMKQGKAVGPRPSSRRKRVRNVLKEIEFEMGFAEPGSPEWAAAWAGLAAVSGDEDREAYDKESGERWQYMGADRRDDRWVHTFRHRWHPRMKKRWYLRVPGTEGWAPKPWPPETPSPDRPGASSLPN